ncbi:MAG: hypothetical protein JWN87_607 [Frankiales bacterium]|jgi:hypothetical protein|nr:hypothetical protein [Frankiales bacterium]MCW2586598.1 hypothetical protein [Frankiales bacterium]
MTRLRLLLAGLPLGALALTGCGADSSAAPASGAEHSSTMDVPGSELKRVTLSAHAVSRLGIETAEVAAAVGTRTSIPYSAVIYDVHGKAWTFVSTAGGSYTRAQITVADIRGDLAHLTSGPAVGTAVVTVGAAELYGTELGVGK